MRKICDYHLAITEYCPWTTASLGSKYEDFQSQGARYKDSPASRADLRYPKYSDWYGTHIPILRHRLGKMPIMERDDNRKQASSSCRTRRVSPLLNDPSLEFVDLERRLMVLQTVIV